MKDKPKKPLTDNQKRKVKADNREVAKPSRRYLSHRRKRKVDG